MDIDCYSIVPGRPFMPSEIEEVIYANSGSGKVASMAQAQGTRTNM
jgi:hypothetical protein